MLDAAFASVESRRPPRLVFAWEDVRAQLQAILLRIHVLAAFARVADP